MTCIRLNHLGLFALGAFLLATACDKDPDDQPEPSNNVSGNASEGGFVLNEGNFNRGNASLAYYNPDSQTLSREVFETTNDRPLGDVLHSVTFHQDDAYLVVNNSGKIEVMNADNFKAQTTITGLPSPRYLKKINESTAYVSNFTQGDESELSIIDLANNQQTGSISTGGWTEQMVVAKGKVFVTEVKAGHLLVVDPADHEITDTIELSVETQSLCKDQDGNVWCLANGGISGEAQPKLYKINPASQEVIESLGFENQTSPSNLTINGTQDTLYYLNDGIYRMTINSGNLPQQAFVKSGNRNFYGLNIHPENSEIYVTDALDYARRGQVYRFDSESENLIDSFEAGMIPRGVRFKE